MKTKEEFDHLLDAFARDSQYAGALNVREDVAGAYTEVLDEIERLREALRPFADAAEAETPSHRSAFEDGDYALSSRKTIDESAYVTWGDLRRASEALKGANDGG